MFSKIHLTEVIDIQETSYQILNIPKIQDYDISNKVINNILDSSKENTNQIDNNVFYIIPIWIQFLKTKKKISSNRIKILLKQTTTLLTIPFKIRKDVEKHIRIYAKKKYGISKKSIVNIVTIKKNCFGIIVNSTCLQKQNLEIEWRHFFLFSTKHTNHFFKYILNSKNYYNTHFSYNNQIIELKDIYKVLSNL